MVDITTGGVSLVNSTGESLTDIGFIGSQMYGVTFGNLFSINKATGASTLIGSTFSDTGMNALVGFGTGLLGASNDSRTFTPSIRRPRGSRSQVMQRLSPPLAIWPLPEATCSSLATGDNGADQLVDASTGTVVGQFHTTTTAGFSNVFGLADDGTSMFAVAGTEIYSVDLSNGLLTPVLDYSGHGLGDANGTAFLAENNTVPEPSTWAMLTPRTLRLSSAFARDPPRAKTPRQFLTAGATGGSFAGLAAPQIERWVGRNARSSVQAFSPARPALRLPMVLCDKPAGG